MKKKTRRPTRTASVTAEEVRHQIEESAFRLRGLAFLLERHCDDPGSPDDSEDCWYGVACITNDIVTRLERVAADMDRIKYRLTG